MESILTWLSNLITNPLVVIGFLLLLCAAIFKDEKSVDTGKTKETINPFSRKSTLRPLPNWLYLTLNLSAVVFIGIGALQLGGVIRMPSSESGATLDESRRRIESFPIKVFAFSGAYDDRIRSGLGFLDVEFRPKNQFAYHFTFNLPVDGTYGYAGFTFWFINPNNPRQFAVQDLTSFGSIELTLEFVRDQHQAKLFIKDIDYQEGNESEHVNYIVLSQTAPPNSQIQRNGREYKYGIPLSAFDKVDFRTVREVGLLADTDVPQDERSFIVREIIFVP